jgi:hypothetical protein
MDSSKVKFKQLVRFIFSKNYFNFGEARIAYNMPFSSSYNDLITTRLSYISLIVLSNIWLSLIILYGLAIAPENPYLRYSAITASSE